jgi:DNA-binding CsgD family transcriptional regulator
MELLAERFADWGLTPAERDVALFAIKGMSTAEIAALRNTSEGTVKAQTNAIYRKAGVSGRPQLLSLFIEDLMGEGLPAVRADAPPGGAAVPVEAVEETRRAAP